MWSKKLDIPRNDRVKKLLISANMMRRMLWIEFNIKKPRGYVTFVDMPFRNIKVPYNDWVKKLTKKNMNGV